MNIVGLRSQEIYGNITLDKINRSLRKIARDAGVQLKIYQSNSEPGIVKILQRQRNQVRGILINPATLCFTGYTIADTLQLINLPTVEIHLTESLVGKSVTDSVLRSVCLEQFTGAPDTGYTDGLKYLLSRLSG